MPVVNGGAELSLGSSGVVEMIDTFDRPGEASAASTFANAGTFANGLEDKPGKRIPKAGAYAEAGVGKAQAEWSVFDAEARGPNVSTAAVVSAGTLNARAFAKAELASASASAGPVKAKVGLAVDTGVEIGLTGVEAKVLGTGFSFGRKMGVSLFGTGFEINLW
ncbi:hypothetical protein CHARACLAT_016107 [Characodon lateralis]|uniref:Uncharacterized protein n=1 Tax=Characodon lateralis TaxID=208331 RepID=A0ABU7F3F9_9TELE|nr:hypothetical protein [Characodon lateralis]